MAEVTSGLRRTEAAFQDLRLDTHQRDVIQWLAAPDSSENFNKAVEQRHEDTGLWFLESDSFAHWKVTANSFLWLNGLPGCGKTILSSTIIQHLRSDEADDKVVLYFFFDFNDTSKQSLENLIRALIRQIYYGREDCKGHLNSLYSSCNGGNQRPNLDSMVRVLQTMIRQCNDVSIVLDALDESQTRKAVLTWVETLLSINHPNLHVLMTSRREEDIDSIIRRWHPGEEIVSIQNDQVDRDIRSYVRARVHGDEELRRWRSRPDVQEEIVIALMKKANGM